MNGPTSDEIAAGAFIPVKEAQKRLGLSRTAVNVLMDRGELRYLRATGGDGRARRVSVVSLDHFIRQNIVTS